MTSKEIAELTGKEHRNVMRDIREMLHALGQDVLSFEQMSQDSYGRPQSIFRLPKDLTITLVSGYNVVMRHRIVTRWQELEAQQKRQSPLAEALRWFQASSKGGSKLSSKLPYRLPLSP